MHQCCTGYGNFELFSTAVALTPVQEQKGNHQMKLSILHTAAAGHLIGQPMIPKLTGLGTVLLSLAFALQLPAPICHGICKAFAPFDIAAGDTLRLNVAMPPNARSGTCSFQAAIAQVTADTCPSCSLAASNFTLSPGESGALEYAVAFPLRGRPVVQPQITPSPNCSQVTASVEVYDTFSRRTRLVDSGIDLGVPNQDGPQVNNYPSAGLTSADSLRINMFFEDEGNAAPANAVCTVHAAIHCPEGCGGSSDVVSQSTTILRPGQHATLNYSDPTIATRRQVRPAISVQGAPSSCRNIVTTAGLVENATGRTFALLHCEGSCAKTPEQLEDH